MAFLQPMYTLEQILSPAHTALIVIDMQNDCCDPNGIFAASGRDVSAIRAVIPAAAELLELCRARGILPIHLQQLTLPGARSDTDAWLAFKTRDGKDPAYCLPGSWGAAFVSELQPREGEIVVQKFRPSGFFGTFLDQILRANGIRTTLFCGNTTEGCVMATVLESSFCGYYTCLVEDGVASSVPQMHQTAMAFLRTRYRVFSSAQVRSFWDTSE